MGRDNRLKAIFSLSNMMTLGVLYALRDLGLTAPRDVSVVGIDDLDVAPLMNPPDSRCGAGRANGQGAIERLLDEIKTKRPPTGKREICAPGLIVRESTAAPSGVRSCHSNADRRKLVRRAAVRKVPPPQV